MISEQAQSGFEYIFKKAVITTITTSADDICEVESMSDQKEISADEFVVLTISSPVFRCFILFHFNSDNLTKSYFENGSDLGSESEENSTFRDKFLEFCNVCCGAMNRELNKSFGFTGMSTPYVLLKRCSAYISALDPGYVKHYRVTINHSFVLHVTLCICSYGALDFKVDTTEVEESTGELEFF